MSPNAHADERRPLLGQNESRNESQTQEHPSYYDDSTGKQVLHFSENDPSHPRNWPYPRKLANVVIIALMAVMSPLASAAFTPAITNIADDLGVDQLLVVGSMTGFVVMLGVGPLVLAPLSETFGRRIIYLVCFAAFTILQVPTALSPNVETLLVTRTLAGFFGAVGIANGGGTISDMFTPGERAGVFGIYLLGPILGPALGPLIGGITVQFVSWRWIFWITGLLSLLVLIFALLFLRETYSPAILASRKHRLEQTERHLYPDAKPTAYTYSGEDPRPLVSKITTNLWRPILILFTQPIVAAMALYQAILWSCNYSLYTQFETIWGGEYGFEAWQVGLMYLPMGFGLFLGALFVVPRIDTVYKYLASKHGDEGMPEYRLPLANIGAATTPACLFAFAWLVEARAHWALIFVLVPFGLGQVTIFNCSQNFYIDAFEKYAASAIAAGSLFRSVVGGVVPIFIPQLTEAVGYGWGISVFGFASVVMAPAPLLFYYYGPELRKRYKVDF